MIIKFTEPQIVALLEAAGAKMRQLEERRILTNPALLTNNLDVISRTLLAVRDRLIK